jgi:hypothetical protein
MRIRELEEIKRDLYTLRKDANYVVIVSESII